MPHALISGASIAGLSSAFWLQRAGWTVTVLERSGAFRDGGQDIDVRGDARAVLDQMGLTEEVRAQNTIEGPAAELEILRGDLARVIRDHLPAQPPMIFGDHIVAVQEEDGAVEVELASRRQLRADLLVVAEGVRSGTRDLLFGDAVERQIRLPSWSSGHACLVGDAAWCATPIGGRGSSLALTAGYVLAAYLSQASQADLGPALERYEKWLRPSADQAQQLPPGVPCVADTGQALPELRRAVSSARR